MKNTLLVIAIAAAGLAGLPATSQAADGKGGFFINGNVGEAYMDNGIYDDNDTGFGFNTGYRWAFAPEFAFGFEVGYVDLGEYTPDFTGALPAGTSLRDAELNGWNLGVNAHWNLSDNWYLSGRTGLFSADVKGDYLDANLPVYVDDTSNEWYVGGGFGYDFSNNFSLGLNYDYYQSSKGGLDLDSCVGSVSGEVRF